MTDLSRTHHPNKRTHPKTGTPTPRGTTTQRNDVGGGSARRARRGARRRRRGGNARGRKRKRGVAGYAGGVHVSASPAPSVPRSVVDPDDVYGYENPGTQGGGDDGDAAHDHDQRTLVWGTTVEVREDSAHGLSGFWSFSSSPLAPTSRTTTARSSNASRGRTTSSIWIASTWTRTTRRCTRSWWRTRKRWSRCSTKSRTSTSPRRCFRRARRCSPECRCGRST